MRQIEAIDARPPVGPEDQVVVGAQVDDMFWAVPSRPSNFRRTDGVGASAIWATVAKMLEMLSLTATVSESGNHGHVDRVQEEPAVFDHRGNAGNIVDPQDVAAVARHGQHQGLVALE